jgi:hypothetical protein
MSIFSPRSSRMMDCTRMPFMPTQAPTLSTSRSRLCTAILVRSPASRAQALDGHRAVVDLRHFLLEQAHHQLRRGARHHDARTSCWPSRPAGSRSGRGRPRCSFPGATAPSWQLGFGLAEVQNQSGPSTRLMVQFTSSPVRPEYSWNTFRARLRGPSGKSPAWRSAPKCGPALRCFSGCGSEPISAWGDAPRLLQRHFVAGSVHRLDTAFFTAKSWMAPVFGSISAT